MESLFSNIFSKKLLIQATFSSPLNNGISATKVTIRPIQMKNKRYYQLSEQVQEKVLHRNVEQEECQKIILERLLPFYKQANVQTLDGDYHLLTSKKGHTSILKKPSTKTSCELAHNVPKKHLLSDKEPLPFLIELGIMNTEGRVFPHKMDKFRQINRFLEMVADTLACFKEKQRIRIIDFGCGKAYLTFALYHFLHTLKGFNVEMHGLDLKSDMIQYCQKLAKSLGYQGLSFSEGAISDYSSEQEVDMAVALHACNTATDAAIAKAISLKAKVILSAPCCQQELYKQVASDPLHAILQHGILKERLAAIATDAARAQILEMCGYETQVLEFIDPEHTPKNLLIRAIFGNTPERKEQAKKCYADLKKALNIHPSLEHFARNVSSIL